MQVTSSVNNLIIGKLYVDHSGIMRIRNTQSNLTARLKFHDAGMFNSKDAHLVLPRQDAHRPVFSVAAAPEQPCTVLVAATSPVASRHDPCMGARDPWPVTGTTPAQYLSMLGTSAGEGGPGEQRREGARRRAGGQVGRGHECEARPRAC